MERVIPIEDLQKLYGQNDMVKADCNGCRGCSRCCTGMGDSIVLDPQDIHTLKTDLALTFEELMQKHIELNVQDGIILPNLKMEGAKEACTFLSEEGRCTIHAFRPGLCRLFPLGRYYEGESFKYYLQSRECPKVDKTKVKVKKWLGIPELKQYEDFISKWHYFLKDLRLKAVAKQDMRFSRECSIYVLENFYMKDYTVNEDFYIQFSERLNHAKTLLSV